MQQEEEGPQEGLGLDLHELLLAPVTSEAAMLMTSYLAEMVVTSPMDDDVMPVWL